LQSYLIAIEGGVKMVLGKKYVVQKSFRIDAKLERDLEILSNVLGRPQNELVNFALINLMQENRVWFAENILIDKASEFFEAFQTVKFIIGNLSIHLYYEFDEDGKPFASTFKWSYSDSQAKIYDGNEYEYMGIYEGHEPIKNILRELAKTYLFNNTKIIEQYLNERIEYK
jgi:predicted DNA-binding protein